MEQVLVEGYVQQRPEALPVSLLVETSLGADSHPGLLLAVNIARPATAWADSAPHLLFEACGHRLLRLVGEVDDNGGQYYVYSVVTEFSSLIILTITIVIAFVAATIFRKKLQT